MRGRIIFVIVFSLILIGGAAWLRFAPTTTSAAGNLIVENTAAASTTNAGIGNTASDTDFEDTIIPNSDSATSTDASSSAPLNDTDLVSRQMLSDYVNLEANGQATPDNLDALGDQYASDVVALNNATTVSAYNLTTVSDSKASFQTYSNAFSALTAKYNAQLIAATGSGKDYSDFGPDSITFTSKLSTIYGNEAVELEALPTPSSLSSDQLQLVNHYFKRSWDMNAIANLNTDPTDASAAITAEGTEDQEEQTILNNIQQVLSSNGIILPTS